MIHLTIEAASAIELQGVLHALSRGSASAQGVNSAAPIDQPGTDDPQPELVRAPLALNTLGTSLTRDSLVVFLNSDSRYNYRTAAAIREHFGSSDEDTFAALKSAIQSGEVCTRNRRRDGETLYGISAPRAAVLDDAEIVGFIESNDRYTQRSGGAIVAHFEQAGHDPDDVRDLLDAMVGEDTLYRRYGETNTFYSVA